MQRSFQFFIFFVLSVLFAAAFRIIKVIPLAEAFAGLAVVFLIVSGIFFAISKR